MSDTILTSRGARRASVLDTAAVTAQVLLPLAARGAIIRRRRAVALTARLGLERRAVRRLQRLRDRYGPGPVVLRLPVRTLAMVLEPAHVHRVLEQTPEPFSAASKEKVAALAQFEPHGLLISTGRAREDRRRFNEAVLDASSPVHALAPALVTAVRAEATALTTAALAAGELDWDAFATAWWRAVRRVVLGSGAADDEAVTEVLARLRQAANWSYLTPRHRRRREDFLARVAAHVQRADPGSLAALVATTPATELTDPVQQVPQWLFAFDAAGIASARALALLAAHPEPLTRVRQELAGRDLSAPQDLPLLRACVQESLRLWPTTPLILRDTTTETTWDGGSLPAGTGLVVHAPFLHRDDTRAPSADAFDPSLWLTGPTGGAAQDYPLVPFSEGPAGCPGRNLVLLVTSTFLATVLERADLRLLPGGSRPSLDPRRAMPALLDHFALRFAVTPRG